MKQQAQTIDKKGLSRVYGHGMGWVFTPSHFGDLGSRAAVESALRHHKQAGIIRQLARGLYDYPRHHPQLGVLSPSDDAVAKALAGRDAIRLQPSGAYAANLLGLSTQVPTKVVFLTDGSSRTVQIGVRQIILKRTTPRQMATAGRISGTLIQALRWMGARHVDDQIVEVLRRRLSDEDKQRILKDMRYAPVWIAEVLRRIVQPGEA